MPSQQVYPEDSKKKSEKNPKEKKVDEKWHVSQETLADPNHVPWKDLTAIEKATKIIRGFTKSIILFLILFTFISTFSLLSQAFKLIGGRGLGNTIKSSKIIQNPVSASIIGMIVTLILQSSSTLISILVGMVSGQLITVEKAIFLMMGSEMGSSIMNALISLTQSGDRAQFRRAFAAATMNDVFNFLCFLILLPIEIIFQPIEKLSALTVSPLENVRTGQFRTLNALTDPLLGRIVQIDEEGLNKAALLNSTEDLPDTFVLRCIDLYTKEKLNFCPYDHIFANSTWSDTAIGIVLLLVCIGSLAFCMFGIVKIMQDLLAGHIAVLLRKLMDKRFPFPFGWLTDYVVMLFGCLAVVILESSSVFRSALTPLVGIGVLTLERLFPLVIGSNIGTTSTGILAALSSDPSKLQTTLQMALSQTYYNVFGAILFHPIPFMRRLPIKLAMKLGDKTAKYRWFAIVYIVTIFLIMPAVLLGISFLPPPAMFAILGILVVFFGSVIVINVLQVKCPGVLPQKLKNWDFLPLWLHSLKPYDRMMTESLSKIPGCKKCFKKSVEEENEKIVEDDVEKNSKEPPVQKMIRLSRQTQQYLLTEFK
ncbi:hypothetical protein FO519_004523 [Halicephalobus sp. NKZ332]|nr:hypothetical protein FO519_004523 [Halicephalobus sp. NKZ332]